MTTTMCETHGVADYRGGHARRLPVPACETGVEYGTWDAFDGGFLAVFDCALEAANYAAELLDEDEQDLSVRAVCRDHEGQPADGCQDCFTNEEDGTEEADMAAPQPEPKTDTEKLNFLTREVFTSYTHAVRRREHARAADFAEVLFMAEYGVHRFDNAGVTLWDDFEEQLNERANDYLQGVAEKAAEAAEYGA
jgi:hypothetical protein